MWRSRATIMFGDDQSSEESEPFGMESKRIATGVLAVVAVVATTFLLSGSAPTRSAADEAPIRPAPSPTGAPAPSYTVSARSDGVLRTSGDQTLYYNDQDTAGNIACTATCATVWHPFILPTGSALTWSSDVLAPLSTTARPDGSTQVTYDGHPLYTYSVDAPGHATGDGDIDAFIGQAYSWHTARTTVSS